jgi:hypothetical protein
MTGRNKETGKEKTIQKHGVKLREYQLQSPNYNAVSPANAKLILICSPLLLPPPFLSYIHPFSKVKAV